MTCLRPFPPQGLCTGFSSPSKPVPALRWLSGMLEEYRCATAAPRSFPDSLVSYKRVTPPASLVAK